MCSKTYIPHPIDTSKIALPQELLGLAEVLAENTHEVWSAERISQGWQYGESRNDGQKLHPCLVEYSALTEDEKVFDRNTSIETLKVLVALGWKLTPPEK